MDRLTTKIKLKATVSKDDIRAVMAEWIVKSPHYSIEPFEFPKDSKLRLESENATLIIIDCKLSSDDILALRLESRDKGNTWVTDCVFVSSDEEKYISVSLSSKAEKYKSAPHISGKPYIIKLLVERKMCADDGIFPITDKPIYLESRDLDSVASLINGCEAPHLPCIYLSCISNGKYIIDSIKLAEWVSGLAHVLVEPDKSFSRTLTRKTESKNAFSGYVGIHFPKTVYRAIIGKGTDKPEREILKRLQSSALVCDSQGNRSFNEIYREIQENEIKKARGEYDELFSTFDDDFAEKDRTIKELKCELEKKDKEIFKLSSRLSSFDNKSTKQDTSSGVSLNCEGINEFFEDEIYDLIVTLMESAVGRAGDGTRQKELLELLLSKNPISGKGEKILEGISDAISNKSIVARRAELERLGFTIERGSHDKIYFHDPKYSFTVAGSASDHRSDDNLFGEIKKKISVYKKLW